MRRSVPLLAVLVGCSPLDDRLQFEVPVSAGGVGGPTFESAGGGEITLTEATVTFSDLRLEEPPAPEDGAAALLRRVVLPNVAYAHPGHDYPGDVAGELLGEFAVDLLGPAVELGSALCYEGEYETSRVHVAGDFATLAGTHVPEAGGEPVPFRFVVNAEQEILDLPFVHEFDAAAPPAGIRVAVDLAEIFAFVDWSLPDEDGDGELGNGDTAFANSVEFGAVASASWSVTTP